MKVRFMVIYPTSKTKGRFHEITQLQRFASITNRSSRWFKRQSIQVNFVEDSI